MSKYSASGKAWQAQRQRVLNRDGWTCAYCGRPIQDGDKTDPYGATVDHIEAIALEPGRNYEDHELISACRTCNGAKGDRALIRLAWFNPRWFGAAS